MKKTLKATLMVAAAFAFGCAAVACGEDEEKKKPTPTEPNTYTVKYDLGTGVTGTAPTGGKYEQGDKFKVAELPAGIVNEGFTFGGWNDGTQVYAAGVDYTMPAHDITFTAKWDPAASEVTYTVTYDLNGGKGTQPTEADKKAGATFKIATGDGISKDGHDFMGWTYKGARQNAGSTFTMPAENVTFVADWQKETVIAPIEGITEFTGNCTLPVKTAMSNPDVGSMEEGGETVVGLKVDGAENKVYYKLQGDADYTESKYFLDNSTSQHKPTDKYGDDAHYIEVQIGNGNLHYQLLIKADLTKLYIYNTDDAPIANGEFTKAEAVDPGDEDVTVTFDLDYEGYGVEDPAAQTVKKGEKLQAFENPQRNGYTFEGWHVGTADGEAFDIVNDTVSNSMTLVAKWTAVAETYTATFIAPEAGTDETVNGTAPKAIVMGSDSTFPDNTFTKVKKIDDTTNLEYTFMGWTDSTANNGVLYLPDESMTFTANKTFKAVFGIKYNDVDGKAPSDAAPQYIVRDDGYLIERYDETGEYDSIYEYTFASDMYSFDVEYSSFSYTVRFTVDNTNKTYAMSDGWQTADITADDGTTKLVFDGRGNVTLDGNTGTYEPLGGELTLNFGDAGVFNKLIYEFDENYIITKLVAKITLNNVTYRFGNAVAVTFSLGDGVEGTAPAEQVFAPGGKAKEPDEPMRTDYFFKAWHVGTLEGDVFDFTTAMNADTTLVAEWVAPVTVTFSLGEGVVGTAPEAQKIKPETTATEPDEPTRTDYLFKAWHVGTLEGEVFDFTTAVTADTTLVAEWVTPVTVTFSLGDGVEGTAPEAQRIVPGTTATAPTAPTRSGYVFVAWHVGTADGAVYDFTTAINADTALVAEWKTVEDGDLLYYFAGAGSANGVKYGYASKTAATTAGEGLVVDSSKTCYYAKVYYNKADAPNNPGRFYIYIYYSSWGSVNTTKINGEYVTDMNTKNQEVVVTSSSIANKEFVVSFSIVENKRTMTITVGDATVTWTEMEAAA